MKAIVEKSLELIVCPDDEYRMLAMFNAILHHIEVSKNENELRNNIKTYFTENEFFRIGFGSSHMWVNQKKHSDMYLDEFKECRILYVEL